MLRTRNKSFAAMDSRGTNAQNKTNDDNNCTADVAFILFVFHVDITTFVRVGLHVEQRMRQQ